MPTEEAPVARKGQGEANSLCAKGHALASTDCSTVELVALLSVTELALASRGTVLTVEEVYLGGFEIVYGGRGHLRFPCGPRPNVLAAAASLKESRAAPKRDFFFFGFLLILALRPAAWASFTARLSLSEAMSLEVLLEVFMRMPEERPLAPEPPRPEPPTVPMPDFKEPTLVFATVIPSPSDPY